MELPFSEDRNKTRFDHISSLRVKDFSSGEVYEAKMLNYSNGGIYFESNSLLQKGAKIYICIENSPFANSSGLLEYYTGEIRWRKYLKRSFFDDGYGIQLSSDPRKRSRTPNFKNVRFSTHKGIHEGRTKNISASGTFIATDEKLKVGQWIRLNLPLKKDKTAKIMGQVVWLNDEGFGLKFKNID